MKVEMLGNDPAAMLKTVLFRAGFTNEEIKAVTFFDLEKDGEAFVQIVRDFIKFRKEHGDKKLESTNLLCELINTCIACNADSTIIQNLSKDHLTQAVQDNAITDLISMLKVSLDHVTVDQSLARYLYNPGPTNTTIATSIASLAYRINHPEVDGYEWNDGYTFDVIVNVMLLLVFTTSIKQFDEEFYFGYGIFYQISQMIPRLPKVNYTNVISFEEDLKMGTVKLCKTFYDDDNVSKTHPSLLG